MSVAGQAVTTISKPSWTESGILVSSNSNRLGPGKLRALGKSTATVEYFYSAAHQVAHEVPLPVIRATLNRQTRCYFKNSDGAWRTGRIGQRQESQYEVHLAGNASRYIDEGDIYVRCNCAIEDPTDVLALKAHDSAFFFGPRQRFLACAIEQRAVSRGLTGLALLEGGPASSSG